MRVSLALRSGAAYRSFTSQYGAKVTWFPGHMAKASAQLLAQVRQCDVLIEVRDARVPLSSYNPALDSSMSDPTVVQATGIPARPKLVVFNKADLASDQLQGPLRELLAAQGAECIFTNAAAGTNVAKVLAAVDRLVASSRASRPGGASSSGGFKTTGHMMLVMGIPNVGKSTLINALRRASKFTASKGAKTGAEPGITRSLQTLQVRGPPRPLYLLDSPGVLPPDIPDTETGMRLLVTGAMADKLVPWSVQAEFLLFYFNSIGSARYAQVLGLPGSSNGAPGAQPYGDDEIDILLEHLGSKLGTLGPRGEVDTEAAARHLVRCFQAGELGRYTLDFVPRPPGDGGDAGAWEAALAAMRARHVSAARAATSSSGSG